MARFWQKLKSFLVRTHTRASHTLALEEAWQLLDPLASDPNEAEFRLFLVHWQFIPAMYVAERTAVLVSGRKDVPREFWTALSRIAGRVHLPREAERYARIAWTGDYIAGPPWTVENLPVKPTR